jgi:hypothetical protein
MTHLELAVRFTDGTGKVVESIREDESEVMRRLDQAAWALVASPLVESVSIQRVEGRTAGYMS